MDTTITYYFSKKVLLTPLTIILFPGLFVAFSLIFDMEIIFKIIIISLSIFILVGLLISNFHLLYSYLTKRPALILSKSNLIDNINKQTFNWSDIFEISLHPTSKLIWVNIGDGYKDKYLNSKNILTKFYIKFHLDLTHGSFWLNPKTIDDKDGKLLDNLIKFHSTTLDKNKNYA